MEVFTLNARTLLGAGALRAGGTGAIRWTQEGGRVVQIAYEVAQLGPNSLGLGLRYPAGGRTVSTHVAVELDHETQDIAWFRCPGVTADGCGRLVGKLFLFAGSDRLACRLCQGIVVERVDRRLLEGDGGDLDRTL